MDDLNFLDNAILDDSEMLEIHGEQVTILLVGLIVVTIAEQIVAMTVEILVPVIIRHKGHHLLLLNHQVRLPSQQG